MHFDVIESQPSIYLRGLNALGMPVLVKRIELEANRSKNAGRFSIIFPMDDIHEGSSYVARHIPSHTTTPSRKTTHVALF